MENREKVLVCITIQGNSRRLIEKGAKIAAENDAKLHILHVEKGMSIFQNPEAAELLESLFEYGKELGGEVHFVSDQEVAKRIVSFIKEEEVSKVVLGETMRGKLSKMINKDITKHISKETKDLEVLVIGRKEEQKPSKTLTNQEASHMA